LIDGQQFHQYQQKEQPPQTTEHKKNMTHGIGNQNPSFGQAQQCGGVKLFK